MGGAPTPPCRESTPGKPQLLVLNLRIESRSLILSSFSPPRGRDGPRLSGVAAIDPKDVGAIVDHRRAIVDIPRAPMSRWKSFSQLDEGPRLRRVGRAGPVSVRVWPA